MLPVSYCLKPANINDSKILEETLSNSIFKRKARSILHADKGYSASACEAGQPSDKNSKRTAEDKNMQLIAPNKKNFKKPLFPVLKKKNKFRYVVEASFGKESKILTWRLCRKGWLKSHKKLILRYEKKITNYESFMLLGFSMITCNKIK